MNFHVCTEHTVKLSLDKDQAINITTAYNTMAESHATIVKTIHIHPIKRHLTYSLDLFFVNKKINKVSLDYLLISKVYCFIVSFHSILDVIHT